MYDVDSLIREPLLLEPLRRSVHEGAPPAYLRSAKIKLTARCNLTCVMCKYGRGLNLPELDGARFITIVQQMAALGCRKVHFSGGEVLARKDFESIAAAAADARLKVAFTSNLTLLTPERAKALMRIKLGSVSTSLDGARAKVHDLVRGIPGSFKKTTRAIERLSQERERRGRRTRLRVNFVMMRENHTEYPALIDLCASLGVTELHPMPVDDKTAGSRRLSRRFIEHYNEAIAPVVLDKRKAAGFSVEPRFVYPWGVTKRDLDESISGDYAQGYYAERLCYAPWTHVFVAWDGKVYLCCMTNGRIAPLGDLSTQSMEDVWRGDAFQALRAQMVEQRLKDCHRCDMVTHDNRQLHDAVGMPATRKRLAILG
jgi:radical SAM protein with 4Fe4S-binding SPASM domain